MFIKNHGKLDSKVDEPTFLGYSSQSKTYKVFNKRTLVVEEYFRVVFDEILDHKATPLD